MKKPVIGISVDLVGASAKLEMVSPDAIKSGSVTFPRYQQNQAYSRAVAAAGGVPILLPHEKELAEAYARMCDAVVLIGGPDIWPEAYGEKLHPKTELMDRQRQDFELALLDALAKVPQKPVLGVCLGIQMLAVHAGGKLHQHLADVVADAESHRGDRRHEIELVLPHAALEVSGGNGARPTVVSAHHQAVADAGRLRVVAKAPDGVIEAIDDPGRRFYLGVQWHPERGGEDEALSWGLFKRLVEACPSARG
ncbi:MAG: type 1 glutamine amidotransferase [Phycisphaeraceae bacterium]|nr:type 1 glutamine amidotransferase [Phycisphaeraceae bacterium]